MQLTIKIANNSRDTLNIFCCNCGSPTDDLEVPTRIYHYFATHPETGISTEGYVLHDLSEGIEKLAAIVLDDVTPQIKFYKQD